MPLHTLRADIDYGYAHREHRLRHMRRQGLDLQGRDHGARPDGAGQEAWPRAMSARRAPGRGAERTESLKRTNCHAATEAHQVPQGVQGPHPRHRQGRHDLNFGSYGLKALEPERVTARQIEAARRAITRQMKRAGRVWIRIFPDVPVSKKPTEVRMGKGKGAPEFWVARVKPGRIMFEIDGVTDADRAARRCASARPSCRSGRASSTRISGVRSDDEGGRHPDDDARPARRRAAQAEEGAVQPALPAGDRPAREHRARARGAPRHRAASRRSRAQKRAAEGEG